MKRRPRVVGIRSRSLALSLLFTVSVNACWSRVGMAEPSPLAQSLTGIAKRDYELGRLLFDNGDFAGALLRFESARVASGDARLLWNAAVCEKALRHYAKAAASMRAFLLANEATIPEETRASARDFSAAAESLTAPIVVTSNVPGADLYVDSELIGQVPRQEPARVDWGAHQILVRMAGYVPYAQTVTVPGPGITRVVAVLRPIVHQGRVVVRAGQQRPISVDGHTVGWGIWEGVLPSGRHSLRVSADGFKAYERQIVVMDDQTQGFDIALEPGPRSSFPTWAWLLGGSALAVGALTAGYFVFKPGPARPATPGTLATIQLELR